MTMKKTRFVDMLEQIKALGDNGGEMALAAVSMQVMALQAENAEYRRKLDEQQARRWQKNGEKLAAYKTHSKPMPLWEYVLAVGWTILSEAWSFVVDWGRKK